MQAVSSPLASAGVDGTTTLSPGTWATHASRVCEWVAPEPIPPKTAVRRVRGTCSSPPDMNRALAVWLTSWSRAMLMKSMIIEFGHRPQPADGGAHRGPDDGRLGDRRVPDPIGPERGGEPLGDLGDPPAGVGQVLPEEDDVRVGGERVGQGGVEGLAHRAFHRGRPAGRRAAHRGTPCAST